MSSESFCGELVDFAVDKMGGVDFLVNNAFSFIAAGLKAEASMSSNSVNTLARHNQIQRCYPYRGCPAIADLEFTVDVLGMLRTVLKAITSSGAIETDMDMDQP